MRFSRVGKQSVEWGGTTHNLRPGYWPTQTDEERNASLVQEYLEGTSIWALTKKYNLSDKRVYELTQHLRSNE